MEYVLNTLEKSISGAINEVNTNVNTEITDRKELINKVETTDTSTVTVGTAEDSLNLLSKERFQNNGQEIALMSDVEDILEPYTVNLTNLLSAQDSESISTAIGGIDNLNATVTKNQVIFGTLANGTVAVGIRVLGNQTTLTYFVDSLVGLTVNEVIITNTSGTLSKTVNTHSVLTENLVVNSLTSDETTLPLSAAQGKALNEKIVNSGKVYVIDGTTLNTGSPTSEQISEAIGGWDNLINAIQNNYVVVVDDSESEEAHQRVVALSSYATATDVTLYFVVTDSRSFVVNIHNSSGELSLQNVQLKLVNTTDSYQELQTSNKTIIGSINEVNTLANSKANSQDITNAINALDSAGQTCSDGEVISAVSQENGVVTVQKKTLAEADIPTLGVAKINGLQSALDAKQDSLTAGTGLEITEDHTINVTLDTTVFFVAEQLPASPTDEQKKKICLIPAVSSSVNNEYTEYVWVVDDEHADGYWEEFGTYTSEVDLTDYLKSADAESTYLKITDAESEYATKTELDGKQNSTDDSLTTTSKTIVGAINEIAAVKPYPIDIYQIMSQANQSISDNIIGGWDNFVTAIENNVSIILYQNAEDTYITFGIQNIGVVSANEIIIVFFADEDTYTVQLIRQENNTSFIPNVITKSNYIDVTTLFADTASITSEISTQIAVLGNQGVPKIPTLYAGSAIGNIKPTWIRTTSGVTNMMCIADNKIWYFEIQGTTVQRAELAIS